MEKNEVSIHEVKVFSAFSSCNGAWKTAAEVAQDAGVATRTARAHCLKLVRLGILDQAEVFPAHRYRLSAKAAKRNVAYHQRIQTAIEVFSL